jgi:hypothetical protein
MQRKTKRPVQFEITDTTRESLAAWATRRNLRFTSIARRDSAAHELQAATCSLMLRSSRLAASS